MKPRFSACCIVKNEEKNLPKWLSCMARVADEMIVVDTGSTDATVKIAQEAGAKVFNFPWIDDFSAAKNYAIDQAKGEWIFFLDADEYFTEESINRLPEHMQQLNKNKKNGCVICRLINIDADRHNAIIDSMLQVRIFRKAPSIRYKGRVHEQLQNDGGNYLMVFKKEIEILHTGYSSSKNLEKAKRNLELLKKKESDAMSQHDKNMMNCYLMDAYNTAGDYEKSLDYAKKCEESGVILVGMEGHVQQVMIGNLYRLKRPSQEIFAVIASAMEKYPDEPVFYFEKGLLYYEMGEYNEALKVLAEGRRLTELIEKRLEQGQFISENHRRKLPSVYATEGDIYYLKGDINKALLAYKTGLDVFKYDKRLFSGFYRCLAGEDNVTIIQIINSLYDAKEDANFLVNALLSVASKEILAYYLAKADNYDRISAFARMERFDSMAVEAGRVLEWNIMKALAAEKVSKSENDAVLKMILSKKYGRLIHKTDIQNSLGRPREERGLARIMKWNKQHR